MPGWREFARAVAPGPLKVVDLAPDRQQEACDILENRPQDIGLFLQDLLTDAAADPTSVGTTKLIPPDPDRRLLHKQDWIDAFAAAPGLPRGHGFLPETQRCPDTYDDPFERRACYSFVRSGIHYIVLDGNPAEGLDGGNIDPSQWEWLTEQLRAAAAADRLVVIASHHPMRRFDNTGTIPGSSSNHTAEELEALLLRFPNVILHLAGHSHENLIVPHRDSRTKNAYWEVNTAAIADWPSQSRSVEIADNRDGTLSIHTVVFDDATAPDPRTIAWAAEDPTSETASGLPHQINESWLASLGRETAFHDPQMSAEDLARAQGQPRDRNAELLLKAPAFLTSPRSAPATPPRERGPVLPATGGSATTAIVLIGCAALALLAVRHRAT
jgi:LPXTG-motif cell wall-anchored protein